MTKHHSREVDTYLRRLNEVASAFLPTTQRNELVADIEAHIATELGDTTDKQRVREVLRQLGEPEVIVREACPDSPVISGRNSGQRIYDAVALGLLLFGAFIPPLLGWLAGVTMLWTSPRWTVRHKLLGTFVWPLGLGAPIVLGLTGSSSMLTANGLVPSAVAVMFLLAAAAAPIAVTIVLARQASRHDSVAHLVAQAT